MIAVALASTQELAGHAGYCILSETHVYGMGRRFLLFTSISVLIMPRGDAKCLHQHHGNPVTTPHIRQNIKSTDSMAFHA
mgnify:CR=1 FL=1